MPKPSKQRSGKTRIYLNPELVRHAKTHVLRNGSTLSGWVNRLVKKALGLKKGLGNFST